MGMSLGLVLKDSMLSTVTDPRAAEVFYGVFLTGLIRAHLKWQLTPSLPFEYVHHQNFFLVRVEVLYLTTVQICSTQNLIIDFRFLVGIVD